MGTTARSTLLHLPLTPTTLRIFDEIQVKGYLFAWAGKREERTDHGERFGTVAVGGVQYSNCRIGGGRVFWGGFMFLTCDPST
jgi:hypothetical protein